MCMLSVRESLLTSSKARLSHCCKRNHALRCRENFGVSSERGSCSRDEHGDESSVSVYKVASRL